MAKVIITIEGDGEDVSIEASFDPPVDDKVPAPGSHIVAMRMLNACVDHGRDTAEVSISNGETGESSSFTI